MRRLSKKYAPAGLVLLATLCLFFPAQAFADPAIDALGEIPVQHGGRIKPFESFAREAVLYVTGKSQYRKIEPARLVAEWISHPEKWNAEPIIPASFPALAEEFGVKAIRGRVSPEVVLEDPAFVKKTQAALTLRSTKEKLSQLDQKRIEVYEKALFFRAIGEGNAPGWIPHPEDPRATWLSLSSITSPQGQSMMAGMYPAEKIAPVLEALRPVLLGFRESGQPGLEEVRNFKTALEELAASRGVLLPRQLIQQEIRYLRMHPFGNAWPCYLAAVLLGLLASFFAGRAAGAILNTASLAFFAGALLLHTYGFYLRSLIAGRPPVTNMYESIVWVSWAAAFFAVILSLALKAPLIRHVAALVAALALILAQKFPALLDPSITPLVPVLRSNLWLTVHVLTITLSYGAFALAWGLGHGALFRFVLRPDEQAANLRLCQFTYRSIQIGVILLAAGTVLGGVWANYSWGRFWGWDPKETWALIALLGYILVLHGRFAGWLKPFGFAAGSVLAFLGVVMAWYGVNFVLAAGLHSYGFGGGGAAYVGAVCVFDAVLVGVLAFLRRLRVHPAR